MSIEQFLKDNASVAKIDLESLRDKYRTERDKRLRSDGEAQYIETSGKYAHYGLDDPYTPEEVERAPIEEEIDVLVVGGGWGGLTAGASLVKNKIENFRILDAAGDFGGVWYWNRYPGCQCDVDAYIYLPLLEETGYLPTQKYAFAPEIYAHAQRIARHFGMYEKAVFQTSINEMRWDEPSARWIVTTNRNDMFRARNVILATGSSSRPKLPGIPGIDDFEGVMFHTSRWDYDYTGGDNTGNLNGLSDKRVAFIGTGGTGIQCVSHLGESAEHLYVFQRTPSSVDLRLNRPTDPEWAKSLKPGWQAERQRNFDDLWAGMDVPDLVDDAFTGIFKTLNRFMPRENLDSCTVEEMVLRAELADAVAMTAKRGRIDAEVKDPKVAERLKPWYRMMCKRPTFNDDYLATFNRPNVTLVDTSECHGVERITPDGIVANGVEYKVDCIIFATGFETTSTFRRRIGIEIFGKGGLSLYDHWSQGMRTFHGHSIAGFPNFFFVGGSQNGFSVNYTHNMMVQTTHVAHIIAEAKRRGAARVEATAEAEEAWIAEIARTSVDQQDFLEACTPGYYNHEGQKDAARTHGLQSQFYGPGPNAFEDLLIDWRNDGQLKGLELS